MSGDGVGQRRALAEELRTQRENIAVRMTEVFLDRHPDWLTRFGNAARIRGLEDARFHIDFLAGAVQSGSASAFDNYALWTARVLDARGIEPHFLIENLQQAGTELRSTLDAEDSATIQRFIDGACTVIRTAGPVATGSTDPNDEFAADLNLYIEAVLGGHRTAALNVALELLRRGLSVPDVYTRLLQAALYEVGRRWELNEISVSTEHMATAITQFVVSHLYLHLDIPDRKHGNAIVTGVQGELHQLGANMVADVLEADGWNVRFLGTQMPHNEIMKAVEEHEPRLIGISTTMLFNLSHVADLVELIRASSGVDTRIIVGGGAFRHNNGAWRDVGADGLGRDLRQTVDMVRALMPTAPE
jgi:methanogenic corrinoid protein MtbC1